MQATVLPHIVVCVCTYQRADMLDELLAAITEQDAREEFTWSARVIDNDKQERARAVVQKHSGSGRLAIDYLIEPIQNISMARNRAVHGVKADYVAMIDDDERPEKDWLWQLWSTLRASKADGVLGPVNPAFPEGAPAWLRKSGICNRPTIPSGKWLEYHQTRTGNVLLRASLFPEGEIPFNPEFGLGGGEDIDFFRRKAQSGHRFIWRNEAGVSETVPEERWKLSYYCRRQLRLGGLLGHRQRKAGELQGRSIARSAALLCFHAVQLVGGLPFGKRVYSKALVAACYHFGYLSAANGVLFLKEREELKCKLEAIVSRA